MRVLALLLPPLPCPCVKRLPRPPLLRYPRNQRRRQWGLAIRSEVSPPALRLQSEPATHLAAHQHQERCPRPGQMSPVQASAPHSEEEEEDQGGLVQVLRLLRMDGPPLATHSDAELHIA